MFHLAFVSKIIERVVSTRIGHHLASNNLYESFQSAYRKHHGTETAMLRVQNDISCDIDQKRVVFLVLLHLSAAFDTIDHSILLSRLSTFGVRGSALESWIHSYSSDRTQAVNVNGCLSLFLTVSPKDLSSVPNSSLKLYLSPIANIARKHGLQVHMYADDIPLYLSLNFNSCEEIESCIKDIKIWMTVNKLKLNNLPSIKCYY